MSHYTSGHTPEDLQRAIMILEALEDELHHRLLITAPDDTDENGLARDCRDVNSLCNRLSIAAHPPPLGGRLDDEPTPSVFLTPEDSALLRRCAHRLATTRLGALPRIDPSDIDRLHHLLFSA